MEALKSFGELTHKITIKDPFNSSPDSAILISIFLKFWIFSRNNNNPSKNSLISLCEQERYENTEKLSECFDFVKECDLKRFLDSVEQLCLYYSLFQSMKLYPKSASLDAKINLICKKLNLMIILKSRTEEGKRFFCGSAGSSEVIHIVYESLKYYPGIHRDEFAFINKPTAENLERFPFKVPQELQKSYKKKDYEQIQILMKSLKSSICHLKQESVISQLKAILAQAQNLGIEENTLREFRSCLNDAGKCKDHKNAVFPCDNIHCIECLRGKKTCYCGVSYQQENLRESQIQLTTIFNPIAFGVNPPPNISNNTFKLDQGANNLKISAPNINHLMPGTQNIIQNQDYNRNVVQQPDYYPNQNTSHFPAIPEDFPPHVNPYNQGQAIGLYNQTPQCWACNSNFNTNNRICKGEHFLCQECSNISFGLCSICEILSCGICGNFILRGKATIYLGYYFHHECLNQRLALFS